MQPPIITLNALVSNQLILILISTSILNKIGIFSILYLYLSLKINSSTGKKKKKLILTESNETYTECSRLQINDMCQTILEENVYWLSNEHRKTRKPR